MPPAVVDRDLVQFIRKQYDESTNTTYFLYRNASHPKCPERRGLVRYHVWLCKKYETPSHI